jgi:Cu-Zn family superoxide dismutase
MKKLAAAGLTLVVPILVLGNWAGAVDDAPPAAAKIIKAVAIMHHTAKGKGSGWVAFVQKGDTVEITGEIKGLPPGEHGFHIHEFGDCSAPDATSTGGHFNPTGKKHGAPDAEERHVGDLGNIKADEDGKAVIKMTDKVIRLDGPNSIIGRGVIIHLDADDFKTQPTGNAGGRVAVGVIGVAKP